MFETISNTRAQTKTRTNSTRVFDAALLWLIIAVMTSCRLLLLNPSVTFVRFRPIGLQSGLCLSLLR